jgi:hypothetical protein
LLITWIKNVDLRGPQSEFVIFVRRPKPHRDSRGRVIIIDQVSDALVVVLAFVHVYNHFSVEAARIAADPLSFHTHDYLQSVLQTNINAIFTRRRHCDLFNDCCASLPAGSQINDE